MIALPNVTLLGNAIRAQVISALAGEVDRWPLVDGKAVRS